MALDQRQYGQKVNERYEIVKTSKIPVATGTAALSKAEGAGSKDEVNEMRGIPYREAVGALM